LDEPEAIRTLFAKLQLAPLQRYPRLGEQLGAPQLPGVYIVYGIRGKVRYVGLARGRGGLRSRLATHLRSHWHEAKYGRNFKTHGSFRWLVVENERQRALLECYAAGCLCPVYIGGIRF
jgi:excinuclease UvrABC nuclease subunit